MRLIGKRSAASALRWVLGAVNVGVLIGILVTTVVAVLLLVSPDARAGFEDGLADSSRPGGIDFVLRPALFLSIAVALGFVWLIINRLRRIFLAVNRGDAFEHANVKRLQMVGIGLIGMELTSTVSNVLAPMIDGSEGAGLSVDFQMWMAILVVFILAEVFRQGAQMRDDAQMTV